MNTKETIEKMNNLKAKYLGTSPEIARVAEDATQTIQKLLKTIETLEKELKVHTEVHYRDGQVVYKAADKTKYCGVCHAKTGKFIPMQDYGNDECKDGFCSVCNLARYAEGHSISDELNDFAQVFYR